MTDTLHLTYQQCDQCQAPLDEAQRYCVVCGASRHHPGDPVARYLAAARRRPTASMAATTVVAAPPRRDERRWLALALACLPLAAALGVLVGRSTTDGDPQVLAALRAQKAPVVQVGGGVAGTPLAAGTGTATDTAAAITSDFSLARGFVVRLSTAADAAGVTKAKADAKDKGAKDVGVLVAADYELKPATKDAYVVYSGELKTRSAADAALKKLRKDFPKAAVVAVSEPARTDDSVTDESKVNTDDVEQLDKIVVRKKPTQQQEQEGAKVVQEIQAKKGKTYVEQQRKLPDTIVVP